MQYNLHTYKIILGIGCIIALTSCASLPSNKFSPIPWSKRQANQEKVKHWTAQGNINLTVHQNTQSAYFKWYFNSPEHYRLHLFGPLGLGSTRLEVTSKHAQLTTNKGQLYTAHSAQALLNRYTRWRLPLKHLYYWVRALPAPHSSIQKRQLNRFHQLKRLAQHNWHVRYIQYQTVKPGLDLPKKLNLQGPNITLTINITHWQLSS